MNFPFKLILITLWDSVATHPVLTFSKFSGEGQSRPLGDREKAIQGEHTVLTFSKFIHEHSTSYMAYICPAHATDTACTSQLSINEHEACIKNAVALVGYFSFAIWYFESYR